MVSTLDFESSDPSSNLGRTYILVSSDMFVYMFILLVYSSINLPSCERNESPMHLPNDLLITKTVFPDGESNPGRGGESAES